MSKIRIDKLLSNMGIGSRNEIKKYAKMGRIRLNNHIEKNSARIVDTEKDIVHFDEEVVHYRKYVYLLMNKPQDVISATFDNQHQTVIDLLPDEYQIFDIFPVGRLDKDTEGLLILTNDGQLAHELLSPKKHIDKKYFAIVDNILQASHIEHFAQGITLDDGYRTMPAVLEILKIDEHNHSHCHVVIQEGKFHQVKRMFADIGMKVLFLKRVQMGNLVLDSELALGKVRELSESEIASLFQKDNQRNIKGI